MLRFGRFPVFHRRVPLDRHRNHRLNDRALIEQVQRGPRGWGFLHADEGQPHQLPQFLQCKFIGIWRREALDLCVENLPQPRRNFLQQSLALAVQIFDKIRIITECIPFFKELLRRDHGIPRGDTRSGPGRNDYLIRRFVFPLEKLTERASSRNEGSVLTGDGLGGRRNVLRLRLRDARNGLR